MIVLDTETTGLIKSSLIPLPQQPHIIEFAAVKLDDTLEPRDSLTFKCNPGIPLDKVITDITGLRDEDLVDKPPFVKYIEEVVDFFIGERVLVAHNCAFDSGMLGLELRRINRLIRFPWPPTHVCTIEATFHLEGHRLHMTELYALAMGRPLAQKHRALDDVNALVEIIRWLREKNLI